MAWSWPCRWSSCPRPLRTAKHTPAPLPAQIDLPPGFPPEGITSGQASRFGTSSKLYVGSRVDGAIWKGSAKTGTGSVLVPGIAGQTALGLHVDWRGRLWVAGGANQTIRVYNAKTGALLQTYTFPTAGFLNDLVITRKGVYATDSRQPAARGRPVPQVVASLAPGGASSRRSTRPRSCR